MKFTDLELSSPTLSSIKELGFINPTPIQQKSIPILLKEKKDFIGLASTGTGKTAAFGLPLIEKINIDKKYPQGLIISPTRELCLQIKDDLLKFSKYHSTLNIVPIYGGSSITQQIKSLKKATHIIVATPGRLVDLINQKEVNLNQITTVIIDEADEILNMGFKDELDKILSCTPDHRITWLFSATMAKGVKRIANNYLNKPNEVSVNEKNKSAENIKHYGFIINEKERFEALKRILDYLPEIYGLVFCRTRIETQKVADKLIANNYTAEAIHGDLSQKQRDAVMLKFRKKHIKILVATDVAARGIDVDDISHVIQYKLSDEADAYTHRSGRTARAGKSGVSITLLNTREKSKVRDLECRNGISIEIEKLPGVDIICENQLLSLIDRVVNTPINEEEISRYLPPVYESLCHLDKKEIIKRFISTEFNHLLDYYRNAKDLNNIQIEKNNYSEKKPYRKRRRPRRSRKPTNIKSRRDNIK